MNRVRHYAGNLSIDPHELALGTVRVEAWRRSGATSTLMSSCAADAQGRFDITVSANLGASDVVFFRVVVDGVVALSSEGMVELHSSDPYREITLVVPSAMSGVGSPPGGPSVSGVVLQSSGGPMPGVTVRAFDEMLRHEAQLGQATTDAQGHYLILYAMSQLAHKGGRPADLLVRAYDAQKTVIAQSAILFRAPEEAQINVVVGGTTFLGFSEFEQVQQALTPELDGASAAALSPDDITFLTNDTALDPERVQDYADASRLAPALGVVVAAVYGLLREGLPPDATGIQATSPQRLREALANAVSSNIVPASITATIDSLIATIAASAVSTALAPPPAGTINVGTIVSASGAPSVVQQAMLKAFSDPEAPPAATWAALRTQVGAANAAAVDRTQLAIQLAVFTHNHPPLIAHLLAPVVNGKPIASLQDLSGLSRTDWLNMLAVTQGGQVIGVPADVPGATDSARRWNYATTLARGIEEAFPSAVLAARLSVAPAPAGSPDLVRFLGQSPTFHLVNTSVDTFVAQNPASLTGITSTAAMTSALKGYQRLARLTPRIDEIQVLFAAGLTSAQGIARMGHSSFVTTFGGQLGVERASIISANASQVVGTALALYARYNPAFNFPVLPSMGWLEPDALATTFARQGSAVMLPNSGELSLNVAAAVQTLPTFTRLFGSPDSCACDDCRSITSPAAYLVDLFQFMGSTAQTALRARRPDLFGTFLSCANTNTPMPYIDLVNEVLEAAVVKLSTTPAPTGSPQAPQTTWSADDLNAGPENLNPIAYDVLAGAVFPWTLPFSLDLEEARIYLQHLGVEAADLMEAFQSTATPPDIISEVRLDVTPVEFTRLTAPGPTATIAPDLNAGAFLQQSQLTYEDLLDLLYSEFVHNPNAGPIRVVFPAGSDCDLDSASISPVTPLSQSLMERFTRIRRHLGWTAYEVDAVFRTFGSIDGASAPLHSLADAKALRAQLGVDVVDMLTWWGPIPIRIHRDGTPSLYAAVFQNQTIFDASEIGAFSLQSGGVALINESDPLDKHRGALAAALNVSPADLQWIIDPSPLGGMSSDLAGPNLTLGNVETCYRITSLARAGGLSVRDLLLLRQLTSINPFKSPADTRALLAARDAIAASPFNLAELGELLLGIAPAPGSPILTEDAAAVLLTDLQSGLLKIALAQAPLANTTADELRKALAAAVPQASIAALDAVVAVAIAPVAPSSADQQALHDALDGALTAPVVNTVVATLSASPPAAPSDRFGAILEPLHAFLRATLSQNLVVQALAVALHADVKAMRVLLTQAIQTPTGGAMDAFLALVNGLPSAVDLDRQNPAGLFQSTLLPTLIRVAKAAIIVSRFKMSIEELTFTLPSGSAPLFAGQDAKVGWLSLTHLPIAPTPPMAGAFTQWQNEVATFAFRDKNAVPGAGVFALLAIAATAPPRPPSTTPAATAAYDALVAPTLAAYNQALAGLTNWSSADLTALTSPQDGLSLTFPSDYASGAALRVLSACENLLARLGASAAQAKSWAIDPAGHSSEIKAAAKAKHDRAGWLAVAGPLRDVLRAQQRDALAAWLVGNAGFEDDNALFDHYLIDVEMSPCMRTSRVKQAIGSTQLFIQRALMNLERGVTFSAEDATQWSWRGRYRVWQANRNVLLYPENYVDPTLRDDMTPFFRDLVNDLGQVSITSDNAEIAYRGYLEKLKDVARPVVMATYKDPDTGTVHVLARTPTRAPKYYYRTYETDPAPVWTPWISVPLDITDDQAALIVWNRHVHVVWLAFSHPTTQPQADLPDPRPLTDAAVIAPRQSLEVRLAWSELSNGKWSSKRVSDDSFDSVADMGTDDNAGTARTRFRCSVYTLENESGSEDLIAHTGLTRAQRSFNPLSPPLVFRIPGSGGRSLTTFEGGLGISGRAPNSGLLPKGQTQNGQWLDGAQPGGELFVVPPSGSQSVLFGRTPKAGGNAIGRTFGDSSNFTVVLQAGSTGSAPDASIADKPFFYRDERRTFFVLPNTELVPWFGPDVIDPGLSSQVSNYLPHFIAFDAPPSPVTAVPELRALAIGSVPISGERLFFPATDQRATTLQVANAFRAPKGTLQGQQAAGNLTLSDGNVGLVAISPKWIDRSRTRYTFKSFYHPYAAEALGRLNRFGLDGLLSWRFQEQPALALTGPEVQRLSNDFFDQTYAPQPLVDSQFPLDEIDVSPDGAYSIYNWEMFFHAPLLIAQKLTTNQRFEEAKRWLEFVFDPTDTNTGLGALSHFWKFKKFFDDANAGGVPPEVAALVSGDGLAAVQTSNLDPFNPFAVARLRTSAFQRATVLAYIDNLVAWGDNLFGQNTLESINEATLFYVLAAELLGPRPRVIEPPAQPLEQQSYDQLVAANDLGDLSDPLVNLENILPGSLVNYPPSLDGSPLQDLFFCVPGNQQILGRWDTVADRLFKVRHCMNIEGQVEQLPLFEPPIDPALLIRAAAAGIDVSSVLDDLSAPLPLYRFRTMSQKAGELAAQVRGLGQELLAALEKKDAEHLALMRAGQELQVLKETVATKQRAIDDAQASHDALVAAQTNAKARKDYYDGLSLIGLLPKESQNLDKLSAAADLQSSAQQAQLEATIFGVIPEVSVGVAGFGGTPTVNASFGGASLATVAQAQAAVLNYFAAQDTYEANRAAIQASQERRAQEWSFQSRTAALDLEQIAIQIIAATARIDMATDDLATLQTQIQNSSDVSDFMRDKYTSEQLYDYMVTRISGTYFSAYQLAYDLAKRAERTFHREIGDEASPASNYIQFGYWDSLQKGLLASERLENDLKRMEAAYLEQNRRELEITKHVSLLQIDPVALTQLKENGVCFVYLPESLFDQDFPGHYMRRIKSLAATIPCQVGPYTSVNCTLNLVRHSTRWNTALPSGADPRKAYPRKVDVVISGATSADSRFVDSFGVTESIVTSSAQGDGGLFEVDLRDERYLPFEGAGAVSLWRIDLPADTNAFDTKSITDLVLHLRYTARDGGDALRASARASLPLAPAPLAPTTPLAVPPLRRLFLASQDFSDAFYRFLHPDPSATDGQSFGLELGDARFPFHDPKLAVRIDKLRVFLVLAPGVSVSELNATDIKVSITDPGGTNQPSSGFAIDPVWQADLLSATFTAGFHVGSVSGGDTWTLQVAGSGSPTSPPANPIRIDPAKVVDIGILCDYEIVPPGA